MVVDCTRKALRSRCGLLRYTSTIQTAKQPAIQAGQPLKCGCTACTAAGLIRLILGAHESEITSRDHCSLPTFTATRLLLLHVIGQWHCDCITCMMSLICADPVQIILTFKAWDLQVWGGSQLAGMNHQPLKYGSSCPLYHSLSLITLNQPSCGPQLVLQMCQTAIPQQGHSHWLITHPITTQTMSGTKRQAAMHTHPVPHGFPCR